MILVHLDFLEFGDLERHVFDLAFQQLDSGQNAFGTDPFRLLIVVFELHTVEIPAKCLQLLQLLGTLEPLQLFPNWSDQLLTREPRRSLFFHKMASTKAKAVAHITDRLAEVGSKVRTCSESDPWANWLSTSSSGQGFKEELSFAAVSWDQEFGHTLRTTLAGVVRPESADGKRRISPTIREGVTTTVTLHEDKTHFVQEEGRRKREEVAAFVFLDVMDFHACDSVTKSPSFTATRQPHTGKSHMDQTKLQRKPPTSASQLFWVRQLEGGIRVPTLTSESLDVQYRYIPEMDSLSVFFKKLGADSVDCTKAATKEWDFLVDYADGLIVAVEFLFTSKRAKCHFFNHPGFVDNLPPFQFHFLLGETTLQILFVKAEGRSVKPVSTQLEGVAELWVDDTLVGFSIADLAMVYLE